MSEHKQRKPGEIKGPAFKVEQRKPIQGRWFKQAVLTDKWLERHYPGYLDRRRKRLEETARKAAEKAEAGKGVGAKDDALELKQVADSDLK